MTKPTAMTTLLTRSVATFVLLTSHAARALDFLSVVDRSTHRFESRTVQGSDLSPLYDKKVSVDGDDKQLSLHWKIDEEFLDVRLIYKGHAWLGFAFLDEEGDDEAVIAKPHRKKSEDRIKKYDVRKNRWREMDKRYQTLTNTELVQDESVTTVSFRKKLKEKELFVRPDVDNKYLLMVGENNHFHKTKETYGLTLNLSGNIVEKKRTKEDFDSKKKSGTKMTAKKGTIAKTDAATKKNDADAKETVARDEAAPEKQKKEKTKTNKHFLWIGAILGVAAVGLQLMGSIAMWRQSQQDGVIDINETVDHEPFIADNMYAFMSQRTSRKPASSDDSDSSYYTYD